VSVVSGVSGVSGATCYSRALFVLEYSGGVMLVCRAVLPAVEELHDGITVLRRTVLTAHRRHLQTRRERDEGGRGRGGGGGERERERKAGGGGRVSGFVGKEKRIPVWYYSQTLPPFPPIFPS
jgi:hypothetical protein